MSTTVRVLHVNRVSHLGGVERVILNLARGGEPGTTVLACPPDGEFPDEARRIGMPVAPCRFDRMRATGDPSTLLRYPLRFVQGATDVVRACRGHRIDVIHTHHPVGTLYAIPASWLTGAPVVLHVHEILPAHLAYRGLLGLVVRFVRAFVTCSNAGLELIRTAPLPVSAPVSVVPNGVAPELTADEPPVPARDVTGPGPHVGVFGVLEPRKGQDVFLRACTEILRVHPDARFWIVGPAALKDKEGYARSLRETALELGIDHKVTFTGFRSDVGRLMAGMDVVVSSSVGQESLSMTILEALAIGRPVVATRVGGAAEAVLEGVTGHVVEPNDPHALATAVLDVLGDRKAEMGRAAREDAKVRFSARSFRAALDVIYAGLVPSTQGRTA